MRKIIKSLIIPIAVGIFEFVWLYFIFSYQLHQNLFNSTGLITLSNLGIRFIFDYLAKLILPVIIILLNRKHLNSFNLRLNNKYELLFLSAIMILLFILHSDYTITGIYRFFYYLITIAFVEEFIYRGFIYNRMKDYSIRLAIVISSVIFAVTHAVAPAIASNADIKQLIILMISNIFSTKLLIAWYLIYLQEKSKTLWIPILVHAIIDYSGGIIGVIIVLLTWVYYLIKSKWERDHSLLST